MLLRRNINTVMVRARKQVREAESPSSVAVATATAEDGRQSPQGVGGREWEEV